MEKDGHLWIEMDVARGKDLKMGRIRCEGRANGTTAWVEVKNEANERPAWLTFIDDRDCPGLVRVIAENTHRFQRPGANFDGIYLWCGELDKEEADQLCVAASKMTE